MQVFSSIRSLFDTLSVSFTLSLEYLLFAGTIFLFFYVWKKRKYWYLKIQQKFPGKKNVWHEIKYSFFTVLIFGVVILQVGWATKERITLVYYPIDKYGYPYYVFSIILMIFLHDAYYYWTHRLLHWKKIFKYVHRIHHMSLNPTPFSAYALHPVEALIDVGIIPLIVFTIPYHVSAITIFSAYTLLLNVMGHLGFEFFPTGFTKHKIFRWHNTPTHHNMHHTHVKYNYSIYFNLWDRLMKTNHPRYDETFEKVVEQRKRLKATQNDAAITEMPVIERPKKLINRKIS